jgi:hypothetical protein
MSKTNILLFLVSSLRKTLLVFLLLVALLGMFLMDINFFSDFALPYGITLDLVSFMFSLLFGLCCVGLNWYKSYGVEQTDEDLPASRGVQIYNKNLDCKRQSSSFSVGDNVYRNVNKNRVGQ